MNEKTKGPYCYLDFELIRCKIAEGQMKLAHRLPYEGNAEYLLEKIGQAMNSLDEARRSLENERDELKKWL